MNKNKIRIGITLRVENIEKYNENRDAISQEWTSFIEKFDGIPIFIPNTLSNTKSFLDELNLDGIILSGGDNFGENKNRDETEIESIKFGITEKIPILGICRGMQVLNNFFGGSIVISDKKEHVGVKHEISIVDKEIERLYSVKKINVNSYHNNLILKPNLGQELKIFAKSISDDTIEGFMHESLPIFGVMWHPEREENSEEELKLMKIFQRTKKG